MMTLKNLIVSAGCCMLTMGFVHSEDGEKGPCGLKKGHHGRGGRPDRQEMIKKFDKDGDGKLSKDERAAAKEAMKTRCAARKANRDEMLKKFDKDGDGTLNDDERKAAMKERLEKRFKDCDKDGDGKLNFDEFAAGAKAHHEKMKKGMGCGNRKGRDKGKGRGKDKGPKIEK